VTRITIFFKAPPAFIFAPFVTHVRP
jgi:hypothetical protein